MALPQTPGRRRRMAAPHGGRCGSGARAGGCGCHVSGACVARQRRLRRGPSAGGALGLCSFVSSKMIGTTPFVITVLLRLASTAERLVTSRDREFKSRKGRQNSRGKHATKHQRTRTEARGATPLWPSGEGARLLATPFAPQSRPAATAALCLASSSGRRACADSTTSPPFPALLLRHRHHITCRCQP